jgi:nucleotide-binding universal stress UspA family protein
MCKTIMVHLDSSDATSARLQFAVTLAKQYSARILGVFAQRAEAKQVGIVISWPSPEYLQAASKVREMFEQLTTSVHAAEFLDINRGSDNEILKCIGNAARYCDLLVFGQTGTDSSEHIETDLPVKVAAISGRPILIAPNRKQFSHVGSRPLIVWNESAESARTIKESLHLIQQGSEVMVLSIGLSTSSEEVRASGNIINFLASHGISASFESVESIEVGSWQLVHSRLERFERDLLIMGAHKQVDFPFVWHFLACSESPVPVFMAT